MGYRLGLSVVFAIFARIFYDASRAFQARYATIEVLRRKFILKDKDCILLWRYWKISSYLAQSTPCLFLQLIPWLFQTIFEIIGAAQDLTRASSASNFPPRNYTFAKKAQLYLQTQSCFLHFRHFPLVVFAEFLFSFLVELLFFLGLTKVEAVLYISTTKYKLKWIFNCDIIFV